MARSIVQTDHSDDEIDLFEIAIYLWEGKAWILGATLLSILAGAIFVLIQKPPVIATIEIRPILAHDLMQYQQLNNTKIVSLTGTELLGQFLDELQLRQTFVQAMVSTNFLQKDASVSENLHKRKIARSASGIKIIAPKLNKVQNNIQPFWQIKFKAPSEDKAIEFISLSFSLTTELLLSNLKSKISAWEKSHHLLQNRAEFNIIQRKNNAIDDYNIVIKNRISYLGEQLAFAKFLEIKNNFLMSTVQDSTPIPVTNISNSLPFYFRGYLAIQKEMNQIKQRPNIENFIPALVTIDQEFRTLKQNKQIKYLNEALAVANLSSEKFNAANFDIVGMKIENDSIRSSIILLICTFIGLLAGSIGYLFWQGMQNFKHEKFG